MPEAEAKLLIHFGLQDTLTREETQALAAQVWQEPLVRMMFASDEVCLCCLKLAHYERV